MKNQTEYYQVQSTTCFYGERENKIYLSLLSLWFNALIIHDYTTAQCVVQLIILQSKTRLHWRFILNLYWDFNQLHTNKPKNVDVLYK